jgi:hypothetical protein
MNVREYPTGEDTEGIFDLGLMSKSPKDSVEDLRSSPVSSLMTFDILLLRV